MVVESKVSVGTTFRIYLPVAGKLPPVPNEPGATPPTPPGRILVMDGEERVRKTVGQMLRRMGHQVELVADGRQAVEHYRSAMQRGCRFDLVLLDLSVRAGVGGQAAVEVLLVLDPTVKAIALNGHGYDPVALTPEHYGFKGVLSKPVETVHLKAILARVLVHRSGSVGVS